MPQHPRGEEDGTLPSLFMFILQVFCVALFSGLFFLVLIPREEQAEYRKRSRVQGFDIVGNDRNRALDTRRVDRSRRARPADSGRVIRLSEAKTHTACPRLPQELVDHIIDCLHDDKQTLRACARTCRSWAPRAQKYLYHTVVIKQGGPDPYTLCFSPAVLAHIRHVVVHGDLCGEIIHSVLSGRTEVTRLDLRNNPRQGSYTVSRAELPSLPGLCTLSLRWVFFRTGRDMLESLSRYRCLSDLTLDFTNFYYAFVAPNDVLPSVTLPTKTLRLKLRSIPVPPDYTYRSRAILRATGAALERLHVMLDSFAPDPLTRVEQLVAVFESLDLITNTSLRSLDVEFRWTAIHSYSSIRRNMRPRLAKILLSQIYSAHLQALTLRIHLSCLTEGADWQQALDLRMLDHLAEPTGDPPMTREATERALARSADLKSVTLKLSLKPISSNEAFSRVEAHLKSQLPKLMKKGILRIEPWSGVADNSL